MNLKRVPIGEVIPWENNPRGILQDDFQRLKRDIKELGVYKPLVVCLDGSPKGRPRYIALGGNMRLRALQELKYKEVDISIVEAPTMELKIRYSFSDNDRAGYYEEEKVAELIYPYIGKLNLGEIKIDLGRPIALERVCQGLGPGGPDFADLEEEVEEDGDLDAVYIKIYVPKKFREKVEAWLANGEKKNPTGFGNGVMKRCGLLS